MTAYDESQRACETAAFRRDLLHELRRIADALAAPIPDPAATISTPSGIRAACGPFEYFGESSAAADPSPTTGHTVRRGVGDEGPERDCDIPPSPRSGQPTADLASIVAEMKSGIGALFGGADATPIYDELAAQLRTFADLISPARPVREEDLAAHITASLTESGAGCMTDKQHIKAGIGDGSLNY